MMQTVQACEHRGRLRNVSISEENVIKNTLANIKFIRAINVVLLAIYREKCYYYYGNIIIKTSIKTKTSLNARDHGVALPPRAC